MKLSEMAQAMADPFLGLEPAIAGQAGRAGFLGGDWELVQVSSGLCLGDWPTAHRYEVAVLPDQPDLVGPLVGNQRRQNELSIGGKLDIEPVPRFDWRENNTSFGIGYDCHKGIIPPETCDSKILWRPTTGSFPGKRKRGQPIASICREHGIQEDTPASRAQFGCAGAEPPARARGDWGYDQWSCQKWPKLWADPFRVATELRPPPLSHQMKAQVSRSRSMRR